jgi:hypothetical protein
LTVISTTRQTLIWQKWRRSWRLKHWTPPAPKPPEFAQHYLQRLAGASDTLAEQVAALDQRAMAQGLTRYDYVRRFLANTDSAIRAEGQALSDLLGRQLETDTALDALRAAPPLLRPWTMLDHLDPAVALSTARDFTPALPLTTSGAIHAGAGFGVGTVLALALILVFRRRKRERVEPRLTR